MTIDDNAPLAGWTPPGRPPSGPLVGRRVRLEPLAAAHVPALTGAYRDGDRVWTFLPYGPFRRDEDFAAWVDAAAAGDDPRFFAVLPATTGRAEGVLSFLRIRPEAGSIELGHINFSPRLQRTRAATEALCLSVGWAFAAGYRRFEWKCDASNLASRRAAQRLGLSFEGVFRQHLIVKGRNRDTAWFAAVDGEWPALRAAYDRWLAPANFDEAGRQQCRLGDLTAPARVARDPAL